MLGFEKERFKVDRIPRIDRMFEKKTHPVVVVVAVVSMYVLTQYESVCSWSFELGWPPVSHRCATVAPAALTTTNSSVDGDDVNVDKSSFTQFYEGSFLRVLLDKLSRMLHQVVR